MKLIFGALLIGLFSVKTYAQDTTGKTDTDDTNDISKLLEAQMKSEDKNRTEYVTATFKTTRLINGHSVENTARHVLDLKINHRFETINGSNGGAYNFFGLDKATMRLGFDYGITNTFMIGVGRSTFEKTFDAFFKWKILKQSTGKHKMPVTLNYVPTIALITDTASITQMYHTAADSRYFTDKLCFTQQLIIGRKFSEDLSLQVMPTWVYRNKVPSGYHNDVFAIGIGGRQKLSKRTSFNAEYYYQLPDFKDPGSANVLSFGFDIETGGHVFQLHFTNTTSMTESRFITGNPFATKLNPASKDILFGFNLSRVFTIGGKKHDSGNISKSSYNIPKLPEAAVQSDDKDKTEYTTATFKTTRLINGHTVENIPKHVLNVKIDHRFGTFGDGAYAFFGLDNATMRLGFDYGLTNNLMIGVGRSTFEKTFDAFFKWKILKQSTGRYTMPVTLSYIPTIALKTQKWDDPNQKNYFTSRIFYTHQLLIGRKFNEGFSLQIMPTYIHRNLAAKVADVNDILAIGIGGRQKLTKRTSFNAEYYYQIPGHKLPGTTNCLSLGFDIGTGGHVFQLHLTNSRGMAERQFISENTGSWSEGDILFGFNISRVFTIGAKRR